MKSIKGTFLVWVHFKTIYPKSLNSFKVAYAVLYYSDISCSWSFLTLLYVKGYLVSFVK